ncbi:hypothetical protein V5O48_011489 [Marasmius crinis-equi]|uniref:Uncharacterized protein n=1 Tax=Marasmius crinis-equi TaxID=585013 RepID=A0ABR3F5U5_9AGAR
MLIAWSEETVRESVNVVLLQNFVVLVCTAAAMVRKALKLSRSDLSVSDAHSALTLTVSPVAIYLVYSTLFRFLRDRPNHLYKRLGTAKVITCTLAIVLLVWWVVFDSIIYFGHVFDSEDKDCKATLAGWLLYKIFSSSRTILLASALISPIPIFWIIYFIRHFKDIREEYRRHMKKTQPWERFRWVQRFGRSIKSFVISQWDVIFRSHQWIFFLTIVIFYVSWGSSLLLWVLDVRRYFYNVVVTPIKPDEPYEDSEDFDPLGYGQLLAAGIAIEPLWNVLKMAFFKRHNIFAWCKQWPQSLWRGTVFILTGRHNPWKRLQEEERQRTEDQHVYKHLFHPAGVEVGELPYSGKESVYEDSLDHSPPGGGSKARVLSPRSASPQMVTAYYDPYDPKRGILGRKSSYKEVS